MTNTERVAYIRGLTEGLELDTDKKEVKVIQAIIELLDDMALSISDLEESRDDMADQLDAVDEDLGTLEDDFYGEDDEDDENEDGDDGFEDDGEEYYEVTCPTCKETICLSEDIIADGQIDCPNCGETLEFDLEDLPREKDKQEKDSCGCEQEQDRN
ncbi:MAG TPA: hypothetical protein DC013_11310 [Ruminococcaceae bacterium]|jgi:DNA-directed RNA polymerase subunit RPC12/RpoP|nr:hypothetical protein [Oscillospiraceae bacterium]